MGRRKVDINKVDLKNYLEQIESEKTFNGQTELYAALAKQFKVSTSCIFQRMKLWGLTPKTTSLRGKGDHLKKYRTEEAELALPIQSERGKQILKTDEGQIWAKNMLANPDFKRNLDLVEKAVDGSLGASIALQCLSCCVGQREEIRNCPCTSCSLWLYRPYKQDGENNLESLENMAVESE